MIGSRMGTMYSDTVQMMSSSPDNVADEQCRWGFNGWVPLRKNETIAWNPNGISLKFSWNLFTPQYHTSTWFYLNGERHPDWARQWVWNLTFLEPELAEENKISVLKDSGFFKDGQLVKGGFVNVNDDLMGKQMPSLEEDHQSMAIQLLRQSTDTMVPCYVQWHWFGHKTKKFTQGRTSASRAVTSTARQAKQ